MRYLLFSLLCLAPLTADPAKTLMPLPALFTPETGNLVMDAQFRVGLTGYKEPRLTRGVQRFLAHLTQRTGIPLQAASTAIPEEMTLEIHTAKASLPVQAWDEDESYKLTVSAKSAKIEAPNPLGALHGMETFFQLIELTPSGFVAPAVTIEDRPRFQWRGLMLDVCRHWMPVAVVKRQLDGMAAVKLNVFHWHLTEDQGFRIETKRYPLLTRKGSEGLFYTQEQVRDVVAYARDRGIRVVPEFDVPGHTSSWLVGYPSLAAAPDKIAIGRTWGVYDPVMDPSKEGTYTLLDGFFGEMSKLFPDAYLHIGGDEVNSKEWRASRRIQRFERLHKLKTPQELQGYFNKRILRILQKYNKRMMGWDEILQPELPKQIVVQSWRGQESLAKSAASGYSAVLSHGYYLDLMRPAEFHYLTDPLEGKAASLTEEQQHRILGGEACMWAEFVSAETVDSRIWPRAAAIAERFWSPAQVRDVDSMYQRLPIISGELELAGLTHRSAYGPMLQRLSGGQPTQSLRVLADLVEPVKGYARTRAREYTSATPLNRFVDAARPESLPAREFNHTAESFAAAPATDTSDGDRLRNLLTVWAANDALLEPVLRQSSLLQEVIPVSQTLSSVSATGLQALQYLQNKQSAPANWKADQLRMLDSAKEAKAEVLLMVVPGVRRLVEAVY